MFAFGIVLVLCLALLTAYSDGQKRPSDDLDQDKIQGATAKTIDTVNAKDSDALQEVSNDTMRSALTDDVLAAVYRTTDESGAFQEIEEVNIAGTSDKNTKEDYAVAVTRVQYERKTFIYTISFTKGMRLADLYYK